MVRRLLAAALALVLAACQNSASGIPSPSNAAHESEDGHAATPSGSRVVCDSGVVCRGPLAAGDYISEGTGARIEFTLDDHDWSGLPETPDVGFGLLLADVPDAAISALAFVGEYFTDACDPDAGTSTIGRTPDEFIEMLSAAPPARVASKLCRKATKARPASPSGRTKST